MSKTYIVKGASETVAFTRVVEQREVLVASCNQCGRRAYVMAYPGQTPRYCSDDCRQEHEKARQREKAKARRAAKKAAK